MYLYRLILIYRPWEGWKAELA